MIRRYLTVSHQEQPLALQELNNTMLSLHYGCKLHTEMLSQPRDAPSFARPLEAVSDCVTLELRPLPPEKLSVASSRLRLLHHSSLLIVSTGSPVLNSSHPAIHLTLLICQRKTHPTIQSHLQKPMICPPFHPSKISQSKT